MSDATPAADGARLAGKLSLALRSFYGNQPDPELVNWLYQHTRARVAKMQSGAADEQPHWRGTEDIAADFLAFLREAGVPLEAPGPFHFALGRYLIKTQNPAGHQLWELLSRALSALRKEKKVWRLDDPDGDLRNNNDAIWTAHDTPAGRRLGDPQTREIETRTLRRTASAGVNRYYDDGKPMPRIIRPLQAKQLVLDLLLADKSATTMRELNRLAQRCVFLLREESTNPLPPGDKDEPVRTNPLLSAAAAAAEPEIAPAVEVRLLEKVASVAPMLWSRLPEELREVFCHYFMPAHFLDEPVVMRELGEPQSVERKVRRLERILAAALPLPEDFRCNIASKRLHGRLVATALEQIFLRHCRKTDDSDASPS